MFNQLPKSWSVCLIGEAILVNPRLDKREIDDGIEVSFVPMPAVSAETGEINVLENKLFAEVKKGYTPFIERDVLFAKITPCMENGKMAVVPKLKNNLGFGSTEFHVLRCPTDILPEYVYYFISSKWFRVEAEHNMTGAVGQRRVPTTFLESTRLPVPPFNEQKRIVAKIEELFSELDNGITALKTAREQLKVYRQAILKHAFEGKLTAKWREENADKLETPEQLLARIQKERDARYQQQLEEWKETVKKWEAEGKEGKKPKKPVICKPMPTISEDEINVLPRLPADWRYVRLAEISAIGSGMSVSQNRKLNNPVEVAYLRVANVQRGLLNLSEIKTMLVEQEALADLLLEKGDVLFNEGGDRDKLGRGWIWENQIESCITQNHVFRATPIIKNEFHSKFISHWGNSFGKDYFEKGGKQTTNLASINKTVLSNFPVPLPSFEEQHQIITILDDAMSLMDAFDSEIKRGFQRAEILRQSILKKAFSGQLMKQDPNDEPASKLLVRIKAQEESQKQPAKKTATKGAQKKVSQEAWN
ncbi:restriction endonuclease [Legionella pneumophila]|uniref:restriction endonuclease subunit S n=1 Tax=Legionella pneumophila TaxID=446 RepID=UPI00101EB204|nr:restriction endonuclease subunit S [Legionella pneumophila]RYX04896.1 restriction endonuclease [Legionella pneumophila]